MSDDKPKRKCKRPQCSKLLSHECDPNVVYCSERCWDKDRIRIYEQEHAHDSQ
jgi:hypothetical protein